MGALLLDLLLDGDGDAGADALLHSRHARPLARSRGGSDFLLDRLRLHRLLGARLVGQLERLGRQAGVGVLLDEGLLFLLGHFLGGNDQVLLLPLASDRGKLGGGVGKGRRLLADVEVEDRLVGRLRARGRREDDRGFGDAPLLEAFHVLLLELHLVLVAEGAEFAFRDHALELLFAELELRHHVFEAEIIDHERLRCR